MFKARLAEEQSANADILRRYDDLLAASLGTVEEHLSAISGQDSRSAEYNRPRPAKASPRPTRVMPSELARLAVLNQAASEHARVRATLEQQVAKLQALEEQRLELNAELKTLLERRKVSQELATF